MTSMENAEKERRLGIKCVSVKNCFDMDPAWRGVYLGESSWDDPLRTWLENFCRVPLLDCVPDCIHKQFEVVRGAYTYSIFYYPLLTLGAEQISRVMETAIALRYKGCAGPEGNRSFKGRTDWLRKQGYISEELSEEIEITRKQRNMASHPTQQWIISPGPAISILETHVKILNELFSSTDEAG